MSRENLGATKNFGSTSPRGAYDRRDSSPTPNSGGMTSPRNSQAAQQPRAGQRIASPGRLALCAAAHGQPAAAWSGWRARCWRQPAAAAIHAAAFSRDDDMGQNTKMHEPAPYAKPPPPPPQSQKPRAQAMLLDEGLSMQTSIHQAGKGHQEGGIDQAHAMIRVLAAQADEARADKSAMWEQTRNDARAMAQVAKNIEGNQGVLAKVVTTLEAQLSAARAEKEAAVEAGKQDKKVWERLLRESERQLREVEKQRDRAQAGQVESNTARKQAQDALETSRRNDQEVLRAVQAEKTAMARELKDLRSAEKQESQKAGVLGGAASNELAKIAEQFEALQSALGVGEYATGGASAAEALREAREARDEAERAKEALKAELRSELLSAIEAREEALAQLASARAGNAPEVQRLEAQLDAGRLELQRERETSERLRAELEASNGAREKLLVQARLDGAALSSREREYSQQMNAKEVQVSALERELATMAGQLVAAQAEVRGLQAAAATAEETTRRERSAWVQTQEGLEADKASLQAQLKAADEQKAELVETVAQCGADRDFCFELIKEMKGQLAEYAQHSPAEC